MRRLALIGLLLTVVVFTTGGAPDPGVQAGAVVAPVNTPVDTDLDGDPDTVRVVGDYNGDGSLTPEDIQDAIDALTDSGVKTVVVDGGLYSMGTLTWPDWNSTGFIEISQSDTVLICNGTVIQGFTTAAAYASESNTADIQVTADRVTVDGCTIDNPVMQAPYDTTSWASKVHWGIYVDGTVGVTIKNNRIYGSQYTAYDNRESSDLRIVNNYGSQVGSYMDTAHETTLSNAEAIDSYLIEVPDGEGANYAAGTAIVIELDNGNRHFADVMSVNSAGDPDVLTIKPPMPAAASAGNYIFPIDTGEQSHGVTIFTKDGTPMRRITVSGNVFDESGDTGIHVRVNAGTDKIEEISVTNNHITRTWGRCMDMAGVRRGEWVGNVCDRTLGIGYSDDGDGTVEDCFATVPEADCTDDTLVENNVLTRGRYISPSAVNGALRIGRGHSNMKIRNNHFDGTAAGACVAFLGAGRGMVFENNTFENCGNTGFKDGAGTGTTFSAPVIFKNTTIRNIARTDIESTTIYGLRFESAHSDVTFDGLTISGCAGPCLFGSSANNQSNFMFKNYVFDGTRSGFLGRLTEAQAALITPGPGLDQTWALITNSSGTSDCDFSGSTGATQNACMIEDTDGDGDFEWKDYGAPMPLASVVQISNTGTQTGLAFISGKVMNSGVSQYGLRLLGAGTLTSPVIQGLYCSNIGQGVRSTDAMAECLRLESTTITGALVSGVHCGGNVTLCTGTALTDTEVGASAQVQSTNTPSGSCASGAIWQDIDTTSQGFYVCDNSAWVDLIP